MDIKIQQSTVNNIFHEFLDGHIISLKAMDGGHINDTYLIETDESGYICQRIDNCMDTEKLEYNYRLFAEAIKSYKAAYKSYKSENESELLYPAFIPAKDGELFYMDENGSRWRLYPYITGDILTAPLTKDQLFETGRGLARIHRILKYMPAKPHAVYPDIHNLKLYLEKYEKLKDLDTSKDKSLHYLISSLIIAFADYSPDTHSIVHGDTKLGNILFCEGKVRAFIDFDTIMTGSILEDIADCIRSSCIVDGSFEGEAAGIIIDGYLSDASHEDAEYVRKNISKAVSKICFELGLRYYMDSFSDVKVFREKYPGYRIENARKLINVSWDLHGGKNL